MADPRTPDKTAKTDKPGPRGNPAKPGADPAREHRRRLKTKVLEGLRIVKGYPDREMQFMVCMGNRQCLPYLGKTVGTAQKTLLKTIMARDTGLKFFRGRCIYQESHYTFIGPAMPSALRKRLERGLFELTGTHWRVRARAGKPGDFISEEDAGERAGDTAAPKR
jgi:hypothetical protein